MHNRSKRSNWMSEAKMNVAYRPFSNGTGSNKYVKKQAARCERRAGKTDLAFDLMADAIGLDLVDLI